LKITVVNLASYYGDAETISWKSAASPGEVLYATLPRNVPQFAADNLLINAAPKWSLINDITVLRVHGNAAAISDDVLDDISARIGDSPLYVLSLEGGVPTLSHAKGPVVLNLSHDEMIQGLRQSDIEALLRRPGVNLPVCDMIHYRGPGGNHYKAFSRPGFALHTTDDFDSLSFWLNPFLISTNRVVVDHWSMVALAYSGLSYANRLGSASDVQVESLTSYDESEFDLTSRFRRAFPVPGDRDVTVILSVNSTGRLAKRLETVLTSVGHTRPNLVALTQAPSDEDGEVHVEALASLHEGHRRQPKPCPVCDDKGSGTAVPIEPNSYLMRLSALSVKSAISKQFSDPVRDVVERYQSTGTFAVHRTHDDGRHHAYYIDVSQMAGTSEFARRLDAAVNDLCQSLPGGPLVILHPKLPAAQRLASEVAQRLSAVGVPIDRLVESDEKGIGSHPDLNGLTSAATILMVDDVVITGRRLLAYRQQLIAARRRAGLDGRVLLYAFVAVARPRTEGALRGARDIVHHTNTAKRFFAVEQLLLPNWSESECSWCRELAFLQGLPVDMRGHSLIEERIQALEQEDQNNLLFKWPTANVEQAWPTPSTPHDWATALAAHLDKYSGWELNPESIFGSVQGPDLLTSVAGSVHRLRLTILDGERVESRLDERFRSPISKTLDPELYLLGRFYEPVLLAAIMRASRAHDLRPPEGDERLDEGLTHQLQYLATSEQMVGELLVQAALGSIPVVPGFSDLMFRSDAEHKIASRFLST
jgi:hypothetical protein